MRFLRWLGVAAAATVSLAGLISVAQACTMPSRILAGGAQKKQPSAQPLDLNQATVEQLQQLPNVGPSTARAIVRFREKSGPFRRVEDLLAIRGITKKRLEKIRPYVTVGAPSSPQHGHGGGGLGLSVAQREASTRRAGCVRLVGGGWRSLVPTENTSPWREGVLSEARSACNAIPG
jgi:competence ComEA-like helix-hairpin-helix protein